MKEPTVATDATLEVADQMIKFLNGLVALDPRAMHQIVETRVPCNQALADHTTVQVRERDGHFAVGILGILNGFVGTDTDGWGFVCAVYGGDGRLVKFCRTPPRKSQT